MTVSEFSAEFDVLFNNITSNQAPGLNDYEKSVFLTNAEYALVNEYFNPVTDNTNGGFDRTPRRQDDFSTLIETTVVNSAVPAVKYDPRSIPFEMPARAWIILNEEVISLDDNGTQYTVVPISYKEYKRLMSKPYKLPLKGQIWRLITNMQQNMPLIELIGKFPTAGYVYKMRYVKKPAPIILEDLSQYQVSIDGQTNAATCELPEEMHREVLERAVTLAKIAWMGGTMTQYAVNASKEK